MGRGSRGSAEEEGSQGLGDAGGDFFERRGASVAFSREKRRAREEGGGSRGRRGRVSRRQEAIARDGRGLGARIEAFAGATIARRARVEGSGARPRKQRGKKIRSRLARVGNVRNARDGGRARTVVDAEDLQPPRRGQISLRGVTAREHQHRGSRASGRARRAPGHRPRGRGPWEGAEATGTHGEILRARARASRVSSGAEPGARIERARRHRRARGRHRGRFGLTLDAPPMSVPERRPRRAFEKTDERSQARRARADGIPGEPVVIY